MLHIALTGNIAAGKSAVADLFRRWGATLIDADEIVREAQAPGTAVFDAIVRRFGPSVVAADGTLDRSALRAAALADPAALADLNGIVHPAVHRRRAELVAEARRRGDAVVVSVIPLLFEVADPAEFDAVVLVDAPEPLRRERLIVRRGLGATDADRLIAAQDPAAPKRARSDYVIDNDGDFAALERRAAEVWAALRGA
jgi:dephospho-CoA kinase